MGKQSAQECLTSLYEPATTATATAMAVHTAQLPHTTPAPTAPHTGMAATVLATLRGMAMATHMAPPMLEHTVLAPHTAPHTAPVMATVTHMGPHMLLATIECDRRP